MTDGLDSGSVASNGTQLAFGSPVAISIRS
jgi:hypothetical protein